MNRERKILIVILYISSIVSISALLFFNMWNRKEVLVRENHLLEKQYVKLKEKDISVSMDSLTEVQLVSDAYTKRFQDESLLDPYELGLNLLEMMHKREIQVQQYKTVEIDKQPYIEYSLEALPVNFFAFLQELYKQELYYHIPYLTLNRETEKLNVSFRIAYAISQ